MAGAFTHFVLCDALKKRRYAFKSDLLRLVSKYSEFLFLGAASPDLPYLSFKTGSVNWADVMHYEKTNSVVISGHDALKKVWNSGRPTDEVKFVWLLGFVSHLVADATIHPVVQEICGPYKENPSEHRKCEMCQDSLIFNDYKGYDIKYAEFSSVLKFCGDSEYFSELTWFWKEQLVENYHDKGEEPDPTLWFRTYTSAIDLAEGDSGVAGLFRHLGVGTNYIYKIKDEIKSQYPEDYKKYYEEVKIPGGVGFFKKDGFEKAAKNIGEAWTSLHQGLKDDLVVSRIVRNWDLDTGANMDSANGEVTFWGVA
jgi:hypothetical protein